ncbi:MAG: hypothetical protein ACOYL7_19745, partial [Caldilinea sp.]
LQTSECDDKDLCTTDACSNNLCLHDKLPGSQCCNKAGDCDDGKVCTLDSCPEVGLACAHTMVDAACCDSAKDCDDGSACTIDSCSKNACLHKNTCCSSDADCADSDPVCTEDKCVAGQCVWTAVKTPECCEPQVLQVDFEAGLPKTWMTSATSKSVQWQVVSGKKSKSGTGSLYYGNPATGNYDDGSSNSGTVGLVAPISVAAGESLDAGWVVDRGRGERLHEQADLAQVRRRAADDEGLQGAGHEFESDPIDVDKGIDGEPVAGRSDPRVGQRLVPNEDHAAPRQRPGGERPGVATAAVEDEQSAVTLPLCVEKAENPDGTVAVGQAPLRLPGGIERELADSEGPPDVDDHLGFLEGEVQQRGIAVDLRLGQPAVERVAADAGLDLLPLGRRQPVEGEPCECVAA